jgi:hypothetical protein
VLKPSDSLDRPRPHPPWPRIRFFCSRFQPLRARRSQLRSTSTTRSTWCTAISSCRCSMPITSAASLPIHAYDTATGRLVAVLLRPGKTPPLAGRSPAPCAGSCAVSAATGRRRRSSSVLVADAACLVTAHVLVRGGGDIAAGRAGLIQREILRLRHRGKDVRELRRPLAEHDGARAQNSGSSGECGPNRN